MFLQSFNASDVDLYLGLSAENSKELDLRFKGQEQSYRSSRERQKPDGEGKKAP
jgi:hypothetical protein